ncbi:hypothetical protein [Paenirhodobacter enshiensis]|uniref:hypothetical protein n=1 Tax=Paenirhodobacter enshiensis TaxID=1105367 RepID=UPI003FA2FAE7
MLQVVEAAGLFALLGPLMVLSIVPGTLLYVISARRRLIGMGARPQWLLLIVPFVLVLLANGMTGSCGQHCRARRCRRHFRQPCRS